MNTTAPTHKAEKPTTYESRNVEIFAAGVHRGKRYTVADLNEIVRNFYRLGPKGKQQLQPPAVIGHEEAQEFLERTDIPAAAWPKRVWRKGLKLFADFGEMPPEIAHAINSRAYRKVSAEIYDDFQDSEGNHHGKALRRIAILGGEIPQVKSLADIPYATPEYEGGADAELRLTKASEIEPGVWRVYCERQSYQSFAWVQSKRRKGARYWVPDGLPDIPKNRLYGKRAEAAANKKKPSQKPADPDQPNMLQRTGAAFVAGMESAAMTIGSAFSNILDAAKSVNQQTGGYHGYREDRQPFRSFAWKKGKRVYYWLPDGKEDKPGNRVYGKAAEAAADAAGAPSGGRPKDDIAIQDRAMKVGKARVKRKAREVGQAAGKVARVTGKGLVKGDDLGMAIRRIYSRITTEMGVGTAGRVEIGTFGRGKSYLRNLQKAQEREQAAYDRAKSYLAKPNTSWGGRKVAQAAISTLGPRIRDIKKAIAAGERRRAEFEATIPSEVKRRYPTLEGTIFPMEMDRQAANAALKQRIRSTVERKMRWAKANRKIYGRGMALAMDVTRAALTIPEALAKVVTGFPYIRDSQMAQDYISTPLQAISKQLPRAGAKLLSRAGRAVRRRIFGGPAAQQSERFAERALRVWTAIRLDDRKDVSFQQVQRFLRFAEQRVERFGEQAFEGFAAEWKPYTNPKTKQQGAKSAAGRVVYGPLAQKVLAAKAKAPSRGQAPAQRGAKIKERIAKHGKKTGDNLRKAVRKKKTVRKWRRRLRAALIAGSETALVIALGIAFGSFGGPVGAGFGAVVGNAIGGAATGGNGPQPPPPG